MTDTPTPPAATPLKVPPESLTLRAAPRSVKRLSRKALAALIGVSVLIVSGAAIWALRSSHRGTAPAEQLYSTDRKASAEGLANLPADYGGLPPGVPPLGPPLPGDLGGPILAAQEEGRLPEGDPLAQPPPSAAEQAAHADRERRLQERRAAIASPLLAIGAQRTAALPTPGANAAVTGQEANASAAPPRPSVSGATDRRAGFMTATSQDSQFVSASRLQSPASPFTLMAGSTIPAALWTGINSDLPGQVIASVTAPVFDSVTGRHLLIPQGARLIGLYDSEVGYGEERALLVWTRLILPDGSSIALERMPSADQAGYAGIADRVDNHWGRLAKGATLSTLLGIGAELAAPRNQGSDSRVIIAGRDGLQDSVNQVGQEITRRNLDIKPTITVRPGFPIRVMVNRDLVLKDYGSSR
ncbi:MAG: TrbI/VirB10 family protein [Sphingobium sp.]